MDISVPPRFNLTVLAECTSSLKKLNRHHTVATSRRWSWSRCNPIWTLTAATTDMLTGASVVTAPGNGRVEAQLINYLRRIDRFSEQYVQPDKYVINHTTNSFDTTPLGTSWFTRTRRVDQGSFERISIETHRCNVQT